MLVDYTSTDQNGTVVRPFGTQLRGQLVYSAPTSDSLQGHMTVHIMKLARKPWIAPDPFSGTAEERASAAASYIAYAGRFTLYPDRVVHHVELSLFPNWVGPQGEALDQVRYWSFEGDILSLRTPPIPTGENEFVGTLRWRLSATDR